VGGLESCDADNRGDDEVGFRVCGAGDGSGGAVDSFDSGDAGLAQARGELLGKFFRGQRSQPRTPANGLREGFVDVAACGERGDGIPVGKLLDDREGALPDGAGGTENGETFQKDSS
jgi:hypothetical protein